MAGVYNSNGYLVYTPVSGTTWVGIYNPNGTFNCVNRTLTSTFVGLYHACGAYNVVVSNSPQVYAPNGALNVADLGNGTFGVNPGRGPIPDTWTPLSLGSNLIEWWSANDPATITNIGGLVSSWVGQKNSYAAIQATEASKPLYNTILFNNHPGIHFDGVNDLLAIASPAFSNGVPYEVWAVASQDALAADALTRVVVGQGQTGAGSTSLRRIVTGGVNRARATVGTGALATLTSVDFSGRHSIRMVADGVNIHVELDGVASPSTAYTQAADNSPFRIGSLGTLSTPNQFWQGTIRHVVRTTILSVEQTASMNNWAQSQRAL